MIGYLYLTKWVSWLRLNLNIRGIWGFKTKKGKNMDGYIHSVETFGTVDGPGVRFVVFVQGCPLRCAYCHNPDTREFGKGEKVSVDKMLEEILKYKNYIEGVTVSGGEPLSQIDFVTELFEKLKGRGLTTCIDTSGATFSEDKIYLEKLDKLLGVCDLVMLDIKQIDSEKHKWLTGKGNENILKFARYLSGKNKDMWLRFVLIPGITDDSVDLENWRKFADTLKSVKKIEVLPYHTLGVHKYAEMGLKYRLEGVKEPTKDEIKYVENILKGRN